MEVFKFGGASIKDSEGIKNLSNIVRFYPGNKIIVVSAIDKTTRILEKLAHDFYYNKNEYLSIYQSIKSTHLTISRNLFNPNDEVHNKLYQLMNQLKNSLNVKSIENFNQFYDQIVIYGELFSTLIVSEYLHKVGITNSLIDIRICFKTDNNYRNANLNWSQSEKLTKNKFTFSDTNIYVTQGFIASNTSNFSTTLGIEGSDYTAAILANMLDAKKIIIWKDVKGILNTDPQIFKAESKIDEMSYREAVEMSYSGAKIIHPKTIKPLENKQIPLFVNSFLNYKETGTIIHKLKERIKFPPIITVKKNQVLLTLTALDFAFVVEDYIAKIFYILNQFNIKLNLIQHSAINFSISINQPECDFKELINQLKKYFLIKYNSNLQLLSIRHYDKNVIKKFTTNRMIFLTQKTRNTIRLLIK